MKLRLDLLEHLTAKDIRQAAEESVHRFKPEPNFSKTGTGTLSSASTKERVKEVEHSMALTRKLERRARRTGKRSESKIVAWKPGDRVKTLRGSLHGVHSPHPERRARGLETRRHGERADRVAGESLRRNQKGRLNPEPGFLRSQFSVYARPCVNFGQLDAQRQLLHVKLWGV